MEPAAPLLPQKFGTWQMQAAATTGNDASQIDSTHFTELKEDGFNRFSTAKYVRNGSTLDVRALQFVDATGAAAALSLYRGDHAGLQPLSNGQKLGTEAAGGSGELLFRGGNTLVIAKAPGVQASELQALAVTLPKISGPKGMSPLLPTLLPPKGLLPQSLRYALGPASYTATGGVLPTELLGFDKSAEAVTASYAARTGQGILTLLLYPTPEIAGDRGRAVEAWVNGHPGGLGTVKMRREGPLVLMTSGSFPAEEAQQMIENIHLRSEVTWDKKLQPEFHTEVKKTASLLVSIVVLSGILMAAAILLGLFLGGGRAAYRVMRGKSAATEPEFLGLGLERGPVKGLSGHDGPARSQ
ncbi:DUF6599 family protein [Granulicella arctica]|uniref:DUF6599 family protein n=1 Tax=Granulicella arctica TaxID=940613 RepID=UPI0021DFD148|nr:DUF6599 family protein [Granulicella arctica]